MNEESTSLFYLAHTRNVCDVCTHPRTTHLTGSNKDGMNNKEVVQMQAVALAEDADIFDYDGAYDSFKKKVGLLSVVPSFFSLLDYFLLFNLIDFQCLRLLG